MRIFLAYIGRDLRKNPLSALLQILSLTVACAVLFLSLNLSCDVFMSVKKVSESMSGGYDVYFSENNEKDIDPDPAIYGTENEILPVRFDGYDDVNGTIRYGLIISADPAILSEREMIVLSEGTLPASLDEVLITSTKASFFGLSVGDEVTMQKGSETVTLRVSGILGEALAFVNDRPDFLECIRPYDDSLPAHRVYVDLAKGEARAYAQAVKHEHISFDYSILNEETVATELSSSFKEILALLVVLTVILACSVVSGVSSMQLSSRIAAFVTFRSVGASAKAVGSILYAENAICGLIGGILGTAIGEIARRALVYNYFHSVGEHPFSLLFALATLAFSVAIQMAVTSFYVHRMASRSVASLMKDKPSAAARVNRFSTVAGAICLASGIVLYLTDGKYRLWQGIVSLLLCVLGGALLIPIAVSAVVAVSSRIFRRGPLSVAVRSQGRSKTDISSIRLVTLSVALTTVVLLSVTAVQTFFSEYKKNFDFDVYIDGVELSDEECEFARTLDGVADVRREYWMRYDISIGDRFERLCFIKENGVLNGVTMLGERPSPGKIVFDAYQAKLFDIRIGDSVPIYFAEKDQTLTFEVVGFCDSAIYNPSRRTVVLCEQDYETYVQKSPTRIDITLEDGYTVEEMLARMNVLSYLNVDRHITVGPGSYYLDKEISKTESALSLFSLVPIFVFLMSFFGVVNNRMTAFRRKRREYAVLYSVAMSRRQLYRMLIAECVMTYATGALIGAGLGCLLTYIMQHIVVAALAYLTIRVRFGLLALTLVAVGAVVTLIGCFAYKRVYKMDAVREIREE